MSPASRSRCKSSRPPRRAIAATPTDAATAPRTPPPARETGQPRHHGERRPGRAHLPTSQEKGSASGFFGSAWGRARERQAPPTRRRRRSSEGAATRRAAPSRPPPPAKKRSGSEPHASARNPRPARRAAGGRRRQRRLSRFIPGAARELLQGVEDPRPGLVSSTRPPGRRAPSRPSARAPGLPRAGVSLRVWLDSEAPARPPGRRGPLGRRAASPAPAASSRPRLGEHVV
jgi:hypothetical protein